MWGKSSLNNKFLTASTRGKRNRVIALCKSCRGDHTKKDAEKRRGNPELKFEILENLID